MLKCRTSVRAALNRVRNPRQVLTKIHTLMGELIAQLEDMLGSIDSGDEQSGSKSKGSTNAEQPLSLVKLYKGETLLELIERWRFSKWYASRCCYWHSVVYDRLYDEGEDRFDLSRIPDVHDNVRFDCLHNPHLGLSVTLNKLYNLSKSMADCVVVRDALRCEDSYLQQCCISPSNTERH